MTPIQIRTIAAAGLASAAVLVLAGGASAPSVAVDTGATGATPRTSKTCQAGDCPVAPERTKVGYGSGGSSSPTPAIERDTNARWGR